VGDPARCQHAPADGLHAGTVVAPRHAADQMTSLYFLTYDEPDSTVPVSRSRPP
jgi:hypothetical protein